MQKGKNFDNNIDCRNNLRFYYSNERIDRCTTADAFVVA